MIENFWTGVTAIITVLMIVVIGRYLFDKYFINKEALMKKKETCIGYVPFTLVLFFLTVLFIILGFVEVFRK